MSSRYYVVEKVLNRGASKFKGLKVDIRIVMILDSVECRSLIWFRAGVESRPPEKRATSNGVQGRLEIHILKCGDSARALRVPMSSKYEPWYLASPPVYSSSPSIKKQNLVGKVVACDSALKLSTGRLLSTDQLCNLCLRSKRPDRWA